MKGIKRKIATVLVTSALAVSACGALSACEDPLSFEFLGHNVSFEVLAKELTLDKDSVRLDINGVGELNATFNPSNAMNKTLTWKSSDPDVVSVDNDGKIKGLKNGVSQITATTDNGLTATCTVSVSRNIIAESITLDINEIELETGYSRYLIPTVSPASAATAPVSWSSSDPSVASVDSSGRVRAISDGYATITAAIYGGLTATCSVRVFTPPPVDHNVIDADGWDTALRIFNSTNMTLSGVCEYNGIVSRTDVEIYGTFMRIADSANGNASNDWQYYGLGTRTVEADGTVGYEADGEFRVVGWNDWLKIDASGLNLYPDPCKNPAGDRNAMIQHILRGISFNDLTYDEEWHVYRLYNCDFSPYGYSGVRGTVSVQFLDGVLLSVELKSSGISRSFSYTVEFKKVGNTAFTVPSNYRSPSYDFGVMDDEIVMGVGPYVQINYIIRDGGFATAEYVGHNPELFWVDSDGYMQAFAEGEGTVDVVISNGYDKTETFTVRVIIMEG